MLPAIADVIIYNVTFENVTFWLLLLNSLTETKHVLGLFCNTMPLKQYSV